ncbi:hypothetical protein OBBRIDRAFT_826136 [Obba rivulosa]|uniref:F-box domain-containing protein n=1 Tax=Obba rivulosa TaxID=1052685 RepID=A0A8E2AXH5_9APHY|nr:hypothetical protein OBBRIDRAFT_826136 [Obba rivulosa]
MNISAYYRIPPELTDRIIDFLHGDAPSLRVCCLTCRSWLPSSRFHLFYSVKLDAACKYQAFDQLLRCSPYLGPYVKEFILDMPPHPPDTLFMSIARRLGAVKLLRIQGWARHVDQDTFAAIGPVTDMTIWASFSHLSDLVALLNAYPHLEKLTLWSVMCGRDHISVPENRVPFSTLRQLRMDGGNETVSSKLFTRPLPSLEALSLTAYNAVDLSALCRLLDDIGSSLHDLDISIWYRVQDIDDSVARLANSLNNCPKLRTIDIASSSLAWTAQILPQVTQAERIALSTRHSHIYDLDCLAGLLSEAHFPRLRSLTFHFGSSHHYENTTRSRQWIQAAMKKRFAGLHARGILSISFS